MYDWLLFLHVLAAFALMTTVVVSSAVVLGGTVDARSISVSNALWNVGGIATLVFGVWLALYVDAYSIWDGWIVGAIVLWVVATGLGDQASKAFADGNARAATFHWLRTAAVLGLLVLMIWKPGA